MPAPTFKKVTVDQFADILDRFLFTRKIDAVHMHHTWRPNHRQFKGHDTIVGMWRFHTQTNHWSDIAQHITIDPQGFIWLGRNWNVPPASASGHNGNARSGPFMFEIIGDFDRGADLFTGQQRDTVLSVITQVQKRFGLPPESLAFHRMLSSKSCPGSSIDYRDTLEAVRQLHRSSVQGGAGASRGMAPPFPSDTYETRQVVDDALDSMARPGSVAADPADADACERGHGYGDDDAAGRDDGARGAPPLTPAQKESLRPHLLNLAMGGFSSEGAWTSSRADVDAMFQQHLPQALEQARAKGLPLRIVFQAHGGLVDEAAGLAVAQKSVEWWKANGIYPIYFVWETGAFETIGQLLGRVREREARDIFDVTSDPVVQEAARRLHGPQIWGGMKLSAQLASAPDTVGNSARFQPGVEGGAYYLAQRLAAFCGAHGKDVQLHAVGHSAGSIFHAWFIPRALALGAPSFRSLQLMAPAVRVDLFKEKLAHLIGPGQGIDTVTMYTMREDVEQDDNCAKVYRKSLLYLIFHALEPERKTPILGLEESLRADQQLSRLFGLDGAPAAGQVVWSRTAATRGHSASTSTTHGGFDDDAPTMGSIARRILDKSDTDAITEYVAAPEGARGGWEEASAVPAVSAAVPVAATVTKPPGGPIELGDKAMIPSPAAGRARRRALCVGINDYPDGPLNGCLADVVSWTRSLSKNGFDVDSLLDARATRAAILGGLEQLIKTSRKGDVIVFQFAGHGTQVPDLDGDEDGGDSVGLDEAICPYDYRAGQLLIDDDIGRLFDQLPDGVNLTCFMDCCHSGSVSRFAMGTGKLPAPRDETEHRRYIEATPDIIAAYRDSRKAMPATRSLPRHQAMREVVFSACMSYEVAWESKGQGDFTARATRLLDDSVGQLSNDLFAKKVSEAFGAFPRQHARLYSNNSNAALPLLRPLEEQIAAPVAAPAIVLPSSAEISALLQGLQRLLQQTQLQAYPQAQPQAQPQIQPQILHSAPAIMQHESAQAMQHSAPQNR